MTALDLTVCLLFAMVFIGALAFVAGGMIGYRRGIAQGRALEWQDDYFRAIEKDRARREKNGQFKPKSTP